MAQALPPRLSFHMIECVSVHEYANAGSFLSYNMEMSILVMEDLDYPPDSLIKTQANGISVRFAFRNSWKMSLAIKCEILFYALCHGVRLKAPDINLTL